MTDSSRDDDELNFDDDEFILDDTELDSEFDEIDSQAGGEQAAGSFDPFVDEDSATQHMANTTPAEEDLLFGDPSAGDVEPGSSMERSGFEANAGPEFEDGLPGSWEGDQFEPAAEADPGRVEETVEDLEEFDHEAAFQEEIELVTDEAEFDVVEEFAMPNLTAPDDSSTDGWQEEPDGEAEAEWSAESFAEIGEPDAAQPAAELAAPEGFGGETFDGDDGADEFFGELAVAPAATEGFGADDAEEDPEVESFGDNLLRNAPGDAGFGEVQEVAAGGDDDWDEGSEWRDVNLDDEDAFGDESNDDPIYGEEVEATAEEEYEEPDYSEYEEQYVDQHVDDSPQVIGGGRGRRFAWGAVASVAAVLMIAAGGAVALVRPQWIGLKVAVETYDLVQVSRPTIQLDLQPPELRGDLAVTDPGTTDPGTTDPGTTDPVTTDPGTTDPITTDPVATTDPGTTDPGTTDPGTTDPGTTDPVTTDPVTTDPGTTDPVATTDPGTTDPVVTDPVTTDPGATDPITTDPGTNPVAIDPGIDPGIDPVAANDPTVEPDVEDEGALTVGEHYVISTQRHEAKATPIPSIAKNLYLGGQAFAQLRNNAVFAGVVRKLTEESMTLVLPGGGQVTLRYEELRDASPRSQDSVEVQRGYVKLKNGERLEGVILKSATPTLVVMLVEDHRIMIPAERIAEMGLATPSGVHVAADDEADETWLKNQAQRSLKIRDDKR